MVGIGCRRRLTDGYQQKYVCWEGHKEGLWGEYWGDGMVSGSEMMEGETIPLQNPYGTLELYQKFHQVPYGFHVHSMDWIPWIPWTVPWNPYGMGFDQKIHQVQYGFHGSFHLDSMDSTHT